MSERPPWQLALHGLLVVGLSALSLWYSTMCRPVHGGSLFPVTCSHEQTQTP